MSSIIYMYMTHANNTGIISETIPTWPVTSKNDSLKKSILNRAPLLGALCQSWTICTRYPVQHTGIDQAPVCNQLFLHRSFATPKHRAYPNTSSETPNDDLFRIFGVESYVSQCAICVGLHKHYIINISSIQKKVSLITIREWKKKCVSKYGIVIWRCSSHTGRLLVTPW